MAPIYAEVELINSDDIALAKKNIIAGDEVKRMTVKMLVDKGAFMLAINETIQKQLHLPVVDKRKVQIGDGCLIDCDLVSVELRFKNIHDFRMAIVLPGDATPMIRPYLLDDKPARIPYYRIID